MLCAANVRIGPLGQTFWARARPRDAARSSRTPTSCFPPSGARSGPSAAAASTPGISAPAGEGIRTRIDSQGTTARLRFRRPGEWVEAVCPTGEGAATAATSGPASAPRRSSCDMDLADGRRDRRRAARDRGRVGRLSPPPHGLALVRRGRHRRRRPRRRLEPGRGRQRPGRGQRAGDLGRRRGRRASPARSTSTVSRRSTSPMAHASPSRRRPSAAPTRTSSSSSTKLPPAVRDASRGSLDGIELAEGIGVMEASGRNLVSPAVSRRARGRCFAKSCADAEQWLSPRPCAVAEAHAVTEVERQPDVDPSRTGR